MTLRIKLLQHPLSIALLLAASTATVSAEPWTYRGTLQDAGQPANGRYDLRLSLLDGGASRSIGSPVTLFGVAVRDGNFAVDVDFGVELSNAPPLTLQTEVAQSGSGFVSLGAPVRFDPKATLAGICWDTTGNVVTAGEFIGSTNSQPLVLRAANVRVLEMTGALVNGAANLVAGAASNQVSSGEEGQTISGGGNTTSTCGSTSNLPCRNQTSDSYATVSGGIGNFAGGDGTVVGGGVDNKASDLRTVVAGGRNNVASGRYALVAGGESNTASGYYSTVSGGTGNCAAGEYSWAGGRNAVVRPGTAAGVPGTACTGVPLGGSFDGDEGTFVWSDANFGQFVSTGANQFLVRASGGVAINTNTPTAGASLTISGNAAIATNGALSFGSLTRQMINLWGPNAYGIGVQGSTLYQRVGGGGAFAWYDGGIHSDTQFDPGTGGTVRMTLSNTGQLRTTTGTIATLSDARLKKDVSDYTGALAQIGALHPVHYRYRDAGKAAFQPEGEHLGFIAQEMQQVFPEWVSTDDEGYLMLSMRGFEAVAVRAIQELEAQSAADLATLKAEKDTEIAALTRRLEALEARLARAPR